ncbi:hypothetical protein ABW19_dt0206907 [Dactylella cylindrospora]|nr:hypothetical protein ABW19_dt0206907 [Dactylella cylindrospora]
MYRFAQDLSSNIFGNPHSASPSSMLSSVRVEAVRARVLEFFHADPEHFDLVFVANATAGIKMVMDGFRDLEGGYWYGYHRDVHNSVVGVREHAKYSSCFTTDEEVESWISSKDYTDASARLFAYPAQSNMNGRRSPLEWCGQVRKNKPNTYTLLDAAAFLTTGRLDLSDHKNAPDFVCMSFYKIFGFPDLGGLIVRKASSGVLTRRKYFAGGTVDMVITLGYAWHSKHKGSIHEALEDGTLPFHNIVALGHAMDVYQELYSSPKQVSAHCSALAKNAYDRLSSLRHSNGTPVCEIYKDSRASYDDSRTQGPTIAFNVRNADGTWVGKTTVEQAAIQRGIHLRTGGVCNPGGVAAALDLSAREMYKAYEAGIRCGDGNDVIAGKPAGIVRISLGAMSSMKDVDNFITFVQEVFVQRMLTIHVTETTGSKINLLSGIKAYVSLSEKDRGSRDDLSSKSGTRTTGGFRAMLRGIGKGHLHA